MAFDCRMKSSSSTRGCCAAAAIRNRSAPGLGFETYAVCDESGARQWQPSDLESFLAFDPSVRTIIFIHGNRITPYDAKNEGLAVYRKLANYAGNGERIRFVIWSWPSSQIRGPLRDVREKAARTGPAGCQLAWLLDQMPAENADFAGRLQLRRRIITGGLHILAGGSLGGCTLARARASATAADGSRADRRGPARSLAGRRPVSWPGDDAGRPMFLVNSCQDMAMRYYRFISRNGNPQALGLRGPTNISAENAAKIEMRDVGRYTGSTHNLFLYLCAAGRRRADLGDVDRHDGPAGRDGGKWLGKRSEVSTETEFSDVPIADANGSASRFHRLMDRHAVRSRRARHGESVALQLLARITSLLA